ncbi:hypothetical protein KGP36_07190 [Patescibacteria group bacterium]|nr:hypothetical protein [Patescibacteria group bacterium]
MGIFDFVGRHIFGQNPEADALASAKAQIGAGYDTAHSAYQPYVTMGQNALGKYQDAIGLGDGNRAIADFHNSPNYLLNFQNAINNGQTGILSKSNGSLASGNTLRALSDYAGNKSNEYYGNYLSGVQQAANSGYGATSTQAGLDLRKAQDMGDITNKQGQLAGANSIWGGLDGLVDDAAKIGGMAFGGGFGPGIMGMAQGGMNSLFGLGGGGQSSYSRRQPSIY